MPIAPSTFYRHKSLEKDEKLRSKRHHSDERLTPEILRVWQGNHSVYGVSKVWKQLKREGIYVARFTVERLMRQLGIQGVRRGRKCITTIPEENAAKPLDYVNRNFTANRPNQLWLQISPKLPRGQDSFMSHL